MKRVMFMFGIATMMLIGGCSRSGAGPDTAAVSGTVFLDGKPAAEVDVTFLNGSFSVLGRTDAEGNYKLSSGVAVGENKVYFSKITGPTGEMIASPEIDAGQLMAMMDPAIHPSRAPKQLIPAQYSDPAITTVSFVVPSSGATDADFELQTK